MLAILPKSGLVGLVITPAVPEAPEAADNQGRLKKLVNSGMNCRLVLSLMCVFFRTEKSTLLVGSTRRYENLRGNVRMLLASWNGLSRLNPSGLVRGEPGQAVAL